MRVRLHSELNLGRFFSRNQLSEKFLSAALGPADCGWSWVSVWSMALNLSCLSTKGSSPDLAHFCTILCSHRPVLTPAGQALLCGGDLCGFFQGNRLRLMVLHACSLPLLLAAGSSRHRSRAMAGILPLGAVLCYWMVVSHLPRGSL